MEHKPITKLKMQANVLLGIGGVVASMTMLLLDYPNLRHHLLGAVLCLASLGQTFYHIWLWKHYPSYEPETVADSTRFKTAIWFGIICLIIFCVSLLLRFLF
jgi:hypothetical protein